MATNNKQKADIDKLLPHGMIATKQWLLEQGIGLHALDNHVKSEKLVSLVNGVYSQAGVMLTWQAVVSSLQNFMKEPVLVGGITAIELLGMGHYLEMSGKTTIHLYSDRKAPPWLNKFLPNVNFVWHGTKRLWNPDLSKNKKISTEHKWREDLPALHLSTAEKAYLELLMEVPEKTSFEHADEIMQGLTSLSPRKIKTLLENCKNIKVKRLFFWFAERHNYPWLKKLDHNNYDLGSGKRPLIKGGKLNQKYQITVPEHMHG